jgi:hypothetical protein
MTITEASAEMILLTEKEAGTAITLGTEASTTIESLTEDVAVVEGTGTTMTTMTDLTSRRGAAEMVEPSEEER